MAPSKVQPLSNLGMGKFFINRHRLQATGVFCGYLAGLKLNSDTKSYLTLHVEGWPVQFLSAGLRSGLLFVGSVQVTQHLERQ